VSGVSVGVGRGGPVGVSARGDIAGGVKGGTGGAGHLRRPEASLPKPACAWMARCRKRPPG
jgi:hypothetical protein